MLCQKCNKNNASVHYEQNINGRKTELHLCPECAKELGIGTIMNTSESFSDMFGGLLGGFSGFGNLLGGLNSLMDGSIFDSPSNAHTSISCEMCGTDLNSLGKSSFLGCPDCYTAFDSFIGSSLDRFQRGHTHRGKRPRRLGSAHNEEKAADNTAEKPLSEAERLRAELNAAVKAENYEKAAELRDKIKELGDK